MIWRRGSDVTIGLIKSLIAGVVCVLGRLDKVADQAEFLGGIVKIS